MTDREIFRENLNYYLKETGKLQKDLAAYVGAKATTVSGWTRGVSYPRADAMEKIAMFFGIPTSKLIRDKNAPETDKRVFVLDNAQFIKVMNELTVKEYYTVMDILNAAEKRLKARGEF